MASPSTTKLSPELVDVVNKFGFQLQTLGLDEKKSSGLCAMNIYHCLSMVAAGSKDGNLEAFGKVMGFECTKTSALNERVNQVIQLDAYSKGNSAVDFSTASSIWHRSDFILNAPWLSTIRNTFHATVGPLEIQPINAFIEHETKGKFKNLFTEDAISNAVLMLVSCLYFKAQWANPFATYLTSQGADFYTWEGNTQTVKMMHKIDKLEYVEDKKFQMCILPYKTSNSPGGPKWKAAIILPKETGPSAMRDILTKYIASPHALRTLLTGGAPSIGSSLLGNILPTWNRPSSSGTPVLPSRSQKINLSLPSFSLKLSLDLKPPLEELGLKPAFQPSDNFAPISSGPLMISQVTHDLFIEVNEEGTEMAAVTSVMMTKSRAQKLPTEMRVDRPFLFVVFDAVTGLVLCEVVVNDIPGGSLF